MVSRGVFPPLAPQPQGPGSESLSPASRAARLCARAWSHLRARPRRLLLVSSLSLALLGAGGIVLVRHSLERMRLVEAARRSQTYRVEPVTLRFTTESSGLVSAVRKVNLSPSVAGRLQALYVREGDRVVAGQVIARMENAQMASRLLQADAQVEAAQADLEAKSARASRYQDLLKAGAIPLDYVEELNSQSRLARIRLEEARSRREEVKEDLRNSILRAPFSGVITRQYAQAGEFVTPTTSASQTDGASSTSVAELSRGLEVVARVSEADLTSIAIDQGVEIRTDAYPGEIFHGRVKDISPRAVTRQEVNAFPVIISLSEGLARLRPAMNVRATFLSAPVREALMVPLACVATGTGGTQGVLVKDEEDQVRFQPVSTGRISGERIQILSGVKPGDRVLLGPPGDLRIPGFNGKE